MTGDLAEPVESRCEVLAACLIDRAVRGRRCWGGYRWVEGCKSSGRRRVACYAEGGGIINPKDFAAAGRNPDICRKICEI